jgi:nicotinate-nucleotide adenylyltransferase
VKGGDRATFFPMPMISISSSAIRDRTRASRPIKYMVPDAVAAYISDHGLYGGNTA